MCQHLPEAEPESPEAEQAEAHEDHQRAERLARDDHHRDRGRLELEAGEDDASADQHVDRHLASHVREREHHGAAAARIGRGPGERAQVGRELAGRRRADEAEDDGAQQRQLDPVGPALEREGRALGEPAQPAVPGKGDLRHFFG